MQANELRIGNYVEYNGMYLQVSEIYSPKPRQPERFNNIECIELLCNGFITCAISEVSPIPLTEEILLRCGFEKEDDDKLVYHGDVCDYIIDKTFDGYDIGVRHVSDINYFSWDIHNLHHLQNLYYALTGQELNIKGL